MSLFKFRKWYWRGLLVAGGLYLLLCTYLWNIVFGLFLVGVTNNAPMYQAAQSAWCKPGDWVLDTFQPMVSDQRMIDHLNKNREAMTRVAEMAGRKMDIYRGGTQAAEFNTLVKALDMQSVGADGFWAENPDSIEGLETSRECYKKAKTQVERNVCWPEVAANGRGISMVSLEPAFGKTHSQYFCSIWGNSFKGYRYYPGGAPRIEDGHLMSVMNYSDRYKTYVSLPGAQLVNNLDTNPESGSFVTRKIDAHWFIVRN